MKIAEAALVILKECDNSMSPKEIYKKIINRRLYEFGAKEPVAVLTNTLRKNSDMRKEKETPLFHYHKDGTYSNI